MSISKYAMLLIAGISLAGLSACSTAKGFGQDVQDTGGYIEEQADDAT
ncbi:MAG: entericidin A/B family lipoprotein [Alphaproteobacteria bacterium]|mgnify:FL=1